MTLVALVRAPERPDEAARGVAGILGVPVAEARMRLAPEPPALLARLAPEEARSLAGALRAAGLRAVIVDEPVPTDQDRTVAAAVSWTPNGATFSPRFGAPVELAWADVVTVLRGIRVARVETERTERSRTLSIGRALATGGLQMTRTATSVVRSSQDDTEQVLLVYPRDARAVLLSEHHVDFSCLGRDMQPSSTANMTALARRLREAAKGAVYDERLVRLGRRPVPFLGSGPSRVGTQAVSVTRTDSSATLDVLAEILRTAVASGLLP